MSVVRYLKALSYDVWVLHDLTETKLVDYISICNSMFNHSKNDSFFFKKKNNMQWKIDCLQQFGAKKFPRETKSRSACEGGEAVYLVDLVGHCWLRTPAAWADIEFTQVQFSTKPIKGSNL